MDNNEQKQTDRLTELGADLTSSKNGSIYTLTIIGQVEGHQVLPDNAKTTKYEHILPLLANIEESDEIDGLLLLLNTVGGDIEAGLAIAEMIAGMSTPTASVVIGGGHSIGIPIAVSCDRSFIVPSATMTSDGRRLLKPPAAVCSSLIVRKRERRLIFGRHSLARRLLGISTKRLATTTVCRTWWRGLAADSFYISRNTARQKRKFIAAMSRV